MERSSFVIEKMVRYWECEKHKENTKCNFQDQRVRLTAATTSVSEWMLTMTGDAKSYLR